MRSAQLLALLVLLGAGAPGAGACVLTGYDPGLVAAWADGVDDYVRGPLDIADESLGVPTHGAPEDALGVATGDTTFSLGDGGFLTARLSAGVSDGPGDDLVVYENAFWNLDGLFAEFAYVEVSSNGVDFARFASATTHTAPVGGFGSVDPCDYAGLAGDKEAMQGSGFDLADLLGHPLVTAGAVDLSDIAYVRVVDVVGDGSRLDAAGMPIYDPYPTVFETGGFDLDAIGALHVPEPSLALSLLTAGAWLHGLHELRRRRARGRSCRGD